MGAHMLDLAEQYVQAGAQVTVMCWPTAPGRRALVRAERLGAHSFATTHPRDPRFADTIVDFLSARPTDVFHVHVGTGRENFDGARAARRAGVPAVVQTQHLPWLLTDTRKRVPFFEAIEQVDRLIAVSAAQRATYESIGVPPELFSTVPNGVRPRGPGPGREAARRLLRLRPDQPVVMTVGRLTVMKGQRYLVDSLPALREAFPDLAVLMVGDGHLRDDLAARASAAGAADTVHFLGHRTDARMLLDAADVFVLPSLHEGMPLAAMEAMDAGLPVVGTDVIGTAEVVADGETGLLVRPRNVEALSTALSTLLSDTELRAGYAAAGRRRYLAHFTSAQMAANTAAVYERVLRSAGVSPGRRRVAR
jgi:glycosyltransferase involved in cell wall biosynthesis